MKIMSNLYEITQEYRAVIAKLSELLESGEIDQQCFNDTLEGESGALENKLTNCAFYIKSEQAVINAREEVIEQMVEKNKREQSKLDKFSEFVKTMMQMSSKEKLKTPYFDMTVKKNPPKLQIDDEQKIPPNFWVQPPQPPMPPLKIDNKALKDALETQEIEGARLVQNTRLEIK